MAVAHTRVYVVRKYLGSSLEKGMYRGQDRKLEQQQQQQRGR